MASIIKRKSSSTKEKILKVDKTKTVMYEPMIEELSYRTHLPKWVCRKVYDAETQILTEIGIITTNPD